MNIGMYQGAAALNGLEQWQQTIAQNLASSSVAGYKKTEISFEVVADEQASISAKNLQTPEATYKISFREGNMVHTGNPLDLALRGNGFFEIETPDGKILYTRDGQFHINADSVLVNKDGYKVKADSGSIQLTNIGGDLAIDREGTVYQGGSPAGKLALTEFDAPQNLQKVAGGFIESADASAKPQRVESPELLQGFIESSNVSPVREMVNLIAVSRAFEANQKILSHFDQELDRTIQALSTAR